MRWYIFLLFVIFSSCIKRFDKPSWEFNALAPLLNTTLSVHDIINDTGFSLRGDSLVIVFSNSLGSFTLDTLFHFDVESFFQKGNLDSVHLNNQRITEKVTLGDLAAKNLLIMFLLPDGSRKPIPMDFPLSIGPVVADGSTFFDSINLKEGTMIVSVTNGFPANLSNVSYTIKNSSSGIVIHSGSFPSIDSNTTKTDTVSLVGKKVEGKMNVNFSLTVKNTGTDSVPINYKDSILVEIRVEDMRIQSAQAVFPAQTIIHHKEVVFLENMRSGLDTMLVKEALIDSGILRVKVISTIEHETSFIYSIPNARKDNHSFRQLIDLPAAPSGGSINEEVIYDFSGYYFYFTGRDSTGQCTDTLNAFYNEVIGFIDSSGQSVYLTLKDSVWLEITIEKLKPAYAKGYLGKDVYSISEQAVSLESFNMFSVDSLSIAGARVLLSIDNGLGIEGNLQIRELVAENSTKGFSKKLTTSSLPEKIIIRKAIDGNVVTPARTVFQLNDLNSNISSLISLFPDKFSFSLGMETNPQGNDGSLSDFAYSSNTLSTWLDVAIPLAVRVNGLVLKDTVGFDGKGIKDVENIRDGKLIALVENEFPLEAAIELVFLGQDGIPLDTLISPYPVLAAEINNATGKTLSARESKPYFPVDAARLALVSQATKVIVCIKLNSIPEDSHVQLFSTYNIRCKVVGDFNYIFNGIE